MEPVEQALEDAAGYVLEQGGGAGHFAAYQAVDLGIVDRAVQPVAEDGGRGPGELQTEADRIVRPDGALLRQHAVIGIAADVVQTYAGMG